MRINQSRKYIADIDECLSHSVGLGNLTECNVLLTGATGTIGSFMADTLIRLNQKENAGIRVLLAGRSIEKLQNQFGIYDNVKFLSYDLNAPIEFDEPVDYVIHVAGNAHPAAFNGDPVGTIVGNIDSTYRLLEYAKNHGGKRFLFVSSGEVYGQGDISLDAFDETYSGYLDVLSPRSCYPLSKRMAENLCVSYWKQYGFESVIVRPCHTYGPLMTASDNRAHAQFLHNALAGEDIIMKSAGTQMRSYNYIADCTAGLFTVLANGKAGEAYNLANPQARVTIAQFAEKVAVAENCKVVFDNPTEADLANRSPISKQVLSTKKLESLGWQPVFSIDEGIQHTLDILKEM